jgi:hypothetical protein
VARDVAASVAACPAFAALMAAGAKPSVRITAAVALLNSRPTADDGGGWTLSQAVALIASARTTIIRVGTSSSQSKGHTLPRGRDGHLKVAAGETFRHTSARLSEESFSLWLVAAAVRYVREQPLDPTVNLSLVVERVLFCRRATDFRTGAEQRYESAGMSQ